MTEAARPYDFRQPQPEPPEVRRQILAWLTSLTHRWADLGRRELHFPWSLRLDSLRRSYVATALHDLPENLLWYPVHWSATAGSLLGVTRPLALGLSLAVLGEKCDALPADRALTEIEMSLWEYVLDHRLLAAGRAGWGREPSPQWQRGAREPAPQFAAVLRQQLIVLLLDLHTEEPLSGGRLVWLLTEAVIEEFFALTGAKSREPALPQEILQAVPLQLIVQLGQTRLPVAELERLRDGDVLLLGQRLDEPLVVLLEDRPRYLAWPGRLGTQRAVQIAGHREE